MRLEARGETQGQEYCASLKSCEESCPEGYGTYRYNEGDDCCASIPCCDSKYMLPCNDPMYYDNISRDYEQCTCPCSDPNYYDAICACLSGIVACVLDPIFKLLALLGIYTSPALNDEEQVKQFLAWAKEPGLEQISIITPSVAAQDSDQWKAQFEQLPLSARRFAMHEFSSLMPDEAYGFVQKRLVAAQCEDESDEMYSLIEQGLNDHILYHPGSRTVINELTRWLAKKPEVSLQTLFSPQDRVRGFLDLWNSEEENLNVIKQGEPGFTWRECFRALPEAAKAHARNLFMVARHSSGQITQLPSLPKDRTSAEGREAYAAYLKVAAEVDEQIYKSEKSGVVIRALTAWARK